MQRGNRAGRATGLVVVCCLMFLWGGVPCPGRVSVSSFRNWDHVSCLDALGDVIAVGTETGVVLLEADGMKTLSTSNGAPFSGVSSLDLGLDGSLWVCGIRGCYRYWQGSILTIEPNAWKSYDGVAALNCDRAWLWNGMAGICLWDRGSFRRVCGEWEQVCDAEVEGDDSIVYTGNDRSVHRLRADGARTDFPGISVQILARDSKGRIYGAGWDGLYLLENQEWVKLGAEPCWRQVCLYENGLNALAVSGDGVVWAAGLGGVLKWTPHDTAVLTEAANLYLAPGDPDYKGTAVRRRVAGLAALPGARVLVGIWEYGLLLGDVSGFQLIRTDLGPPSCISSLCEDRDGRLWCGGLQGPAALERGQWRHFWEAESFLAGPVACMGSDALGRVWLGQGRAIRIWDGTGFRTEEASRRGMAGSRPVGFAASSRGEVWLSMDPDVFGGPGAPQGWCGVACVGDLEWGLHPWSLLIDSPYATGSSRILLDRGNNPVWFFTCVSDGITRASRLDGSVWRNWPLPAPLDRAPHGPWDATMGLDGSLLVCTGSGLFRVWDGVAQGLAQGFTCAPSCDAQGTVWAAVLGDAPGDSGVAALSLDGSLVKRYGCQEGLTDVNTICVLIDHDGTKWAAAGAGVSAISDGGPAQQELTLEAVARNGVATLNGTFTNAGAVIPVLLWLACEYDGTLYYYPGWGPTPQGTKRVLGAYSIKSEELVRLDASTLPAGDYTFYGGISLLGGMDLLIGARGAKIAVAAYHKE